LCFWILEGMRTNLGSIECFMNLRSGKSRKSWGGVFGTLCLGGKIGPLFPFLGTQLGTLLDLINGRGRPHRSRRGGISTISFDEKKQGGLVKSKKGISPENIVKVHDWGLPVFKFARGSLYSIPRGGGFTPGP